VDSLKLLSCAEDFVIRVWDLVLKKEVAVMKPKGKDDNMAHMTTSLVFTNDKKTLITGGRDSCLHFWNTLDNFKHISSVKIENLGALKFDEINALVYVSSKDDPCIIIGGSSGQVLVYSIKR
jgi:WD40 repeat protein